jgi:hypothetical protein
VLAEKILLTLAGLILISNSWIAIAIGSLIVLAILTLAMMQGRTKAA